MHLKFFIMTDSFHQLSLQATRRNNQWKPVEGAGPSQNATSEIYTCERSEAHEELAKELLSGCVSSLDHDIDKWC
jgi:hypothetical protein